MKLVRVVREYYWAGYYFATELKVTLVFFLVLTLFTHLAVSPHCHQQRREHKVMVSLVLPCFCSFSCRLIWHKHWLSLCESGCAENMTTNDQCLVLARQQMHNVQRHINLKKNIHVRWWTADGLTLFAGPLFISYFFITPSRNIWCD